VAIDSVIDADLVAAAIIALMAQRGAEWKGTASQLLTRLSQPPITTEEILRSRSWPKEPRILSNRLHRAAPFLRHKGIEVIFDREGHKGTRIITLSLRQQ
jgi:hypothetical protein